MKPLYTAFALAGLYVAPQSMAAQEQAADTLHIEGTIREERRDGEDYFFSVETRDKIYQCAAGGRIQHARVSNQLDVLFKEGDRVELLFITRGPRPDMCKWTEAHNVMNVNGKQVN